MARYSRSIKGELVDFDLFEVKRKIGEKPVSADVKNREKFIYSKRRRGSKKAVENMMKDQPKPSSSVEGLKSKVEPTPEPKKAVKRKIIKKK